MDLDWQIQIVDQLIRENPETTVKEYLQLISQLRKLEDEVNGHNKTISQPSPGNVRRPGTSQ